MEVVLIFPHQLFEKHPALKKSRLILFIEESRFFSEFCFHQKKLAFHRASLKSFEKSLKKKGYKTRYIEEDWESVLKEIHPSIVYVAELDDVKLQKDLAALKKSLNFQLNTVLSPGFLTDLNDFRSFFEDKRNLRCETFYINQRKKIDLLLDEKGRPLGGKWSFDQENRKKIPKFLKIPPLLKTPKSDEVKKAIAYVKKKYPNNPGELDPFNYPVTHTDAKKALKDFLRNRLNFFGDYEDAIVQQEEVLFHSCLSALLNVGLLTPHQVIAETIEYSKTHQVSLNSLEGFIRQVAGWREFVRGVYHLVGETQRKQNFFRHVRKIPKSFYEASTGILPIDDTIKKLKKNAYLHHIERLMVLGNFFLLCEIDPKEVYRWFMELSIDAYDWVMVPNVYGMSQYADGGMMTTKPYFSGSNYLLKMSDYPRGRWCEIWDALFWRFMIKHLKFFEKQPRLSVLCRMAKKKKREASVLKIAEAFLNETFEKV